MDATAKVQSLSSSCIFIFHIKHIDWDLDCTLEDQYCRYPYVDSRRILKRTSNELTPTMDPTKAQTTATFAHLKSQKPNKVGRSPRSSGLPIGRYALHSPTGAG